MSVSEREQAMLVHRERRMAIMIAAYAASSTKGANHDILQVLPLPKLARKGVSLMNPLISFLVAVAAGVVCHYIIKWLDGDQ